MTAINNLTIYLTYQIFEYLDGMEVVNLDAVFPQSEEYWKRRCFQEFKLKPRARKTMAWAKRYADLRGKHCISCLKPTKVKYWPRENTNVCTNCQELDEYVQKKETISQEHFNRLIKPDYPQCNRMTESVSKKRAAQSFGVTELDLQDVEYTTEWLADDMFRYNYPRHKVEMLSIMKHGPEYVECENKDRVRRLGMMKRYINGFPNEIKHLLHEFIQGRNKFRFTAAEEIDFIVGKYQKHLDKIERERIQQEEHEKKNKLMNEKEVRLHQELNKHNIPTWLSEYANGKAYLTRSNTQLENTVKKIKKVWGQYQDVNKIFQDHDVDYREYIKQTKGTELKLRKMEDHVSELLNGRVLKKNMGEFLDRVKKWVEIVCVDWPIQVVNRYNDSIGWAGEPINEARRKLQKLQHDLTNKTGVFDPTPVPKHSIYRHGKSGNAHTNICKCGQLYALNCSNKMCGACCRGPCRRHRY